MSGICRKDVFNETDKYYGELFPHVKGKQKMVSKEWITIKNISNDQEFLDAVKTMKDGWKTLKQKSAEVMKNHFFGSNQASSKIFPGESLLNNSMISN